ncbi:MAG: VWA domain-containing protein [Clostridiales bacterium]|nr:VWA domain-containing protein [Clostridiales bacterium]
MNKRLISALSVLLVLLTAFFSSITAVYADDTKIRAVDVNLPDAVAEISGDVSIEDIDEAKIGSEELTAVSVKDDCTRSVYMLIDISTSMEQSKLNALKPYLIKYAESLGENDKFVLMTFGKEIKALLKDGESNSKIESAINGIECNSDGTTFYSAINKAFNKSQDEDYDRKYAIVVSDGADYETGEMSKSELIDVIDTHKFPIYGMCISTVDKDSADNFGEICRTSGGGLKKFDSSNAKERFDSLKKIIKNVTMVEFEASSKKSLGTEKLKIKIGGTQIEADVDAKAKDDSTAPEVEEITYEKSSNSFVITFSEPVENIDGCTVTYNDGKKELALVEKKYASDEKDSIKLAAESKIYSGKYTFNLSDVTDMSDSQNSLAEPTITQKVTATPIIVKILIIVGIVLIPVVFLLALYLILLNLKKKKKVDKIKDIFITQVEEAEQQQVHIVEEKKPSGKSLVFNIIKGNGQLARAEFNVSGSMFVGRSDMCELCIDDNQLSRQYIVAECVESGFAITDLQTTNGTYVNGVPIRTRTFVTPGDKIMIGNTTLILQY